jgi:cytochrome c oxidase assembly protein subunit 15
VTHRLAIVTAAATLALIVLGGLVTGTGAALAVPDWPTTFGHNMFLFPWSEMVGGVFYEHSHRLLGAVVGLLTIALAAALWPAGGRLRWLGLIAAVGVAAQGIVGGLRVVLVQDALAIVHGCLAQAFLGLLAALVVLTSPGAAAPGRGLDGSLRTLSGLAAALAYLQIVSGAFLTHAGWVQLHLVGALAVFALLPVAAARLRRSGDPVAAPLAGGLLALLGVQLALGAGSFIVRFGEPVALAGGALTALALPVLHRVTASLILGVAVMIAVRVALATPSLRTGRTAAGDLVAATGESA